MSTARDRPPEEAAEDSSLARGLRLLLTVADRGDIRADDLAGILEMPLSTAYRYLRTLAEFGFVDRHDGRYRLGPRLLIGTSGSNVSSDRLIRLSDPVLRMLVDEVGETGLIMRRVGLAAMCLHQVESKRQMRVVLEPGAMSPLYVSAPSRVLLAFAPPEILDELLDQGGIDPAPWTTASRESFEEGLAEIRSTRIAMSEGELIPGTVSVAVPILDSEGIVGALGIIGPEARCGLAWRSRVRKLLPEAAETIMAGLEADR